ncbi:hypothetical protein PLESTB_001470000 [Pleodorina starrii]|uniref:rRNA methylase n=1 Tax=Pleodorina starrii TaxID=330485 RepID=A0A9W6BWC5_9CHLO|nr:hypothetical protein PLESTM_001688300 [Pleodorina starrii]GLC59283.1 hypothetical protein PLESTB_001470000 [Pleodorina starrii]GLC74846.1 hypothetical protein PLESTF_001562500 [Pleodorina starrii]
MLRQQVLARTRTCGVALARPTTRHVCNPLAPSSCPRSSSSAPEQLRCCSTAAGTTPTASVAPEAAAAAASSPSLQELLSTGARLTTAAQAVWAQVLLPGDTAVDATCGNGHDTLFMAQVVGPSGHVHGFDIQDAAIVATRERLESHLSAGGRLPALSLHRACHSRLQELCGSGVARVVAFNLGYLPGAADKRLITTTQSTLAAVEAALEVVMPGGVISILAYVGHPGGQEEYDAVRQLVSELSPSYWVSSETRLLNRPTAPILILLWRRDARVADNSRR